MSRSHFGITVVLVILVIMYIARKESLVASRGDVIKHVFVNPWPLASAQDYIDPKVLYIADLNGLTSGRNYIS